MNQEELQREYLKCAADPVYFLNKYGYVFDARKQRVEKMTCFGYQEDCVFKFNKYRNNIILKSRQCLPENTFIDTPNGPKAIQDFKIGDELYSFNLKTNEVEIDYIKDAWCSGDRQCVKFKLQDTRNFEVGENHPFFVKDKGFVKAADLQRGDEILDANLNFGEKCIDENEVKILAYLITDGCTNTQVKFTNNNLKYLQEFEGCINNIFPELEIRKVKKDNGFDYYPHQKHGTSNKNDLMKFCERYNIANKKTEYKILPSEVFLWDKNSVALLINRMFAGDGWISIYERGNSRRLEVGIASPSMYFLEQTKSLLKKFDIKCNIYEVKNMKLQKNKFFKLRITHSKSIIKFVNEIGIFDKVNDGHYDICNSYKHDVKSKSIIKKIEKTEIKNCFDISVEKNENFLVNGLLTHNTGLSVITAGYVAWRLIFRVDEKILIIANDGRGAVRFLSSVKQFVDYTPRWLLPGNGERVVNNQKEIKLKNNSFAIAQASSSEAGRGDSLTLLVLDETAFIENAETIWMAAGLALSVTQGKCIMVSTPKGSGGLYHSIWEKADEKADGYDKDDFVPTRVHWTQNPYCAEGIELREDEGGEKIYWSPWYEGECKRMQYDKVKIAQELDLSFEGSKYLAIENDLIVKYNKRLLLDEYKLVDKNKTYYDYKNRPGERFVNYKTNFTIYKKYITGNKYILGCLPLGEKVLTDKGLINIEDVLINDKLVGEDGRYVEIINKQIYNVVDEDTYEIKLCNTERTTKFTKEHPILVSQNTITKRVYDKKTKTEGKRYWDFDFKYKKAEKLQIGDWVKIPNIYKNSLNFNINEKWSFFNNVRKDFIIDSPIDNKDFWWFIGFWLGDGWISKYKNSYSITLCFNKLEKYYLEKSEYIIRKLFKREPSITEKKGTYDLTFNCKELYYFILENFGQYSYGKKINEWVKYIPNKYKLEIIKGYFDSDGCWVLANKKKYTNSKISFVSINMGLLESIQDILFSLGIISSLNKLRDVKEQVIRETAVFSKKCYNLCLANFDSLKLVELLNDADDIKLKKFKISDFCNKNKRIISYCHFSNDEEFIYFKIRNIEKSTFTGKVYNFECDTHTFVCHHMITHNCDVSRGDGKDYSTAQIVDINTLEVVGEYRDKIAPDLLAHVLYNVGMDYGEAYLVIECNNHGLATAIDVSRKMNYKRMYYSKNIKDTIVRPYDYKVNENEIIPGFQTTQRTRPLLVNSLRTHLRDGELKIYSKLLMNEFSTFIQNGDRPEAEKGKNDDLIFALGIALFIRDTEYKNASESAEMYKGMLDAIGFVSNGIDGQSHNSNPSFEEMNYMSDLPPDSGGIFFNDFSKKKGDIDDFDDTDWLLMPIPKNN